MAQTRDSRVGGALRALALPVLVLVVVVAVGTVLWGRGDLNDAICDGACGPSNVLPPVGLADPVVPGRTAPATSAAAGPVDPDRLSAAVRRALGRSVLGPRVGFTAVDPADGTTLASTGSGAYVPASTTKVLTAYAALATIDPGTTFTTDVVRDGDRVVLVGGGDPYLVTKRARRSDPTERADLTTLARRTAQALRRTGTTEVSLGYDASLFSGPAASPAWEPSYTSQDIVTPVSALWVDEGVSGGARADDPADAAAQAFARLLARRGIDVRGRPVERTAPAGAERLARVRGATVAQVVERLVRVSDNEAAEVVLRHVAIASGRPASFTGGAAAVRAALEAADVDTSGLRLTDGSGLSRRNRVSPATLVGVLGAAGAADRTAGLLADLPVGGFTGTLVDRFAGLPEGRGAVRAKTGTLTGVHSLAGYAVDADGRPVLFAVMADRTDRAQPFAAQAALDEVAAAIAGCRCG